MTFLGLESIAQEVAQPAKVKPDLVSVNSDSVPERDHLVKWLGVQSFGTLDGREINQVYCQPCRQRGLDLVPYWATFIELPTGASDVKVSIQKAMVAEVPATDARFIQPESLSDEFTVAVMVRKSAGKLVAAVTIETLRKSGSRIQRLEGFNLAIEPVAQQNRGGDRGGNNWKQSSILASGEWLKIATGKDGVFKLTYSEVNQYLGLGNSTNSVDLRLYGQPAGMLPMANALPRPDDLEPISIQVVDGDDGIFGPGDYILFYGEDQITWDLVDNRYVHNLNPFSDSTFYFFSAGGEGEIRRVQIAPSLPTTNYESTTYDYLQVYEEDLINLINSGRTWYGERLGTVSFKDIGFSVPNIDRSSNVRLRATFAARSIGLPGVSMRMSLPNQGGEASVAAVSPVADFYGALYADDGTLEISTAPLDGNMLTKVEINNASNPLASAWIDYVELNARRSNVFLAPYMSFRDRNTVGENRITEFNIQSSQNITVWDVTDKSNVTQMALEGSIVNGFRFNRLTTELKEFIAFNEVAYQSPRLLGRVQNQNLHGLAGVEYLVVTHPMFIAQAQRIADLHSAIDGMTSAVVTTDQIYNEFSGGAQDVTAIKEFCRKLYFEADSTGAPKLKYLLLFGDASYDYKDRISGNSNFVPTHQMRNSLSPTGSIASDDFFGLLDDDEGESPYDFVDIGIGRLPARSRKEAEDMVNKIVSYANTSSSFGEWRNLVAFIADDADPGDRHTFMRDFEGLGSIIDAASPEFIVRKLYMDAFKQQVGSGGQRYPEGAEAIRDRVQNGALMVYFIGHGGELGWAHERILEVPTINKWSNRDKLPLFITATCEFARFDDPRRTSGGEYTLLNPSGGGIALLTTTRAVYANPNLILSTEFTTAAFANVLNANPRLGDLMLQTKVRTLDTNSTAALNSRSFALLGDPALRLAYPELDIRITEVPDTIRALDKVKIEGYVADAFGNVVDDFNGLVYPSVFDKELELQTLNNDGSGPFPYKEWKNLVFKGKATVKEGRFAFEFVVPKDINRAFGEGRVSLYAHDGNRDAHGDQREFIIGGLSKNPIIDEEGPEVDVYMNNIKFVFGGLTDQDPDLYAEVRDDNGINMVGSGIGHDITAVLDQETSKTIVLNEYYEAEVDSYTEGKILYPFSNLEEGRHSLKLQVWDVNNNPGEGYTEFVVANSEEFALAHVLNYPNPFTTNTQFFFEHNKPGQGLDVSIEVFTVAGKLVKSIRGEYFSDGFRVGPIAWNGLDEYGDQLAKGVYIYKVKVKTVLGESVEKYERLVLLK